MKKCMRLPSLSLRERDCSWPVSRLGPCCSWGCAVDTCDRLSDVMTNVRDWLVGVRHRDDPPTNVRWRRKSRLDFLHQRTVLARHKPRRAVHACMGADTPPNRSAVFARMQASDCSRVAHAFFALWTPLFRPAGQPRTPLLPSSCTLSTGPCGPAIFLRYQLPQSPKSLKNRALRAPKRSS